MLSNGREVIVWAAIVDDGVWCYLVCVLDDVMIMFEARVAGGEEERRDNDRWFTI